jgi:hypothetical protein
MSNQTIVNGNTSSVNIFSALDLTPRQIERQTVMTQPAFAMGQAAIPLVMSNYGDVSSIKSGSRLWEIPRMSNQFKKANVQATSGTGTTVLQVTLTDPNYNAIPQGTLVQDPTSGTLATVVNISNGQMTLVFDSNSNSSATTFATTDFTTGALISPRGSVGNNSTRQDIEGSYTIPEIDAYPIGTWDRTCTMSLEELKRETYIAAVDGTNYYAKNKQMEVLNEMYTQFYAYMYSDAKGITNDLTPRSPSLINQIKTYAPNNIVSKSRATITLSEFQSTAKEFIRNGSLQSDNIMIFGGLDYLENIYDILKPYVFNAGTTNVLGGSIVKGLDVQYYKMLGKTFTFMLDMFTENANIFGRTRTNSALWVDAAKVTLQNGTMTSPIYKVYNAIDGLHAWNVNGGCDINGNLVKQGSTKQLSASTEFRMEGSWILANPKATLYHSF